MCLHVASNAAGKYVLFFSVKSVLRKAILREKLMNGVFQFTLNISKYEVSRQNQSEIEWNRTPSNSIRGSSSIESGNRTKSNTERCVSSTSTSRTHSNKSNRTELNPLECIRLWFGSRTQSKAIRPIEYGE